MKNIINKILVIIVCIIAFFKCSCSSYSSVEDLYGTYTGTDNSGSNICIELTSKSCNEWKKYGHDRSDDLVYKDSKGKLHSTDWQTIEWTWDLDEGYVKVYYNGWERYIIDLKREKIYGSWGQYLDDRNGYSFSKR